MKVLITTWRLDNKGGIVNYVKLLINNINNNLQISHFAHGSKLKYHKPHIVLIIWIYQFVKFCIILDKKKPDLIHLNPSLIKISVIRDFIFLNISKSMGFPVLIFFRGWRWSFFEKIKNKTLWKYVFLTNLSKTDKILVLSKDYKEALIDIGVDKDKIEISSTMVESELYATENKNFDKPYNILFCGHMVKYKGIYELLDAIPIITDYEKDLNFIFMGSGPELKNLKKKIEGKEINEYVTFTGHKTGEEKYDIYKKAHLFVLPSYTEGFPNVALEAMAAGLPIIATPVGALKYAIEDGKNGWKLESVPPRPDELAEKIIELIEDPDLMKEMSENNLLEAKSKYDVKAVTDDIIKIYREICFDNN